MPPNIWFQLNPAITLASEPLHKKKSTRLDPKHRDSQIDYSPAKNESISTPKLWEKKTWPFWTSSWPLWTLTLLTVIHDPYETFDPWPRPNKTKGSKGSLTWTLTWLTSRWCHHSQPCSSACKNQWRMDLTSNFNRSVRATPTSSDRGKHNVGFV